LELTADELKNDLNVSLLGHRKLILSSLAQLKDTHLKKIGQDTEVIESITNPEEREAFAMEIARSLKKEKQENWNSFVDHLLKVLVKKS
jgi:hypothetical protein